MDGKYKPQGASTNIIKTQGALVKYKDNKECVPKKSLILAIDFI